MRLGHEEVDFAEVSRGIQQVRDIWPQEIGELEKYAQNLPLFREFEFLDLIVKLHHLRRFDECRLSGCGFVVYESRNPFLVCCTHRNEHLSVTYGYTCVTVYDSIFLSLLEDCAHSS